MPWDRQLYWGISVAAQDNRLPVLRRAIRSLRLVKQRAGLRLGRFAYTTPLSRQFGFDRGLPIDRHYIERFLAAHATDIRGRALEIGDDDYCRRFGGPRIVQQDVLHVHAENPLATIIGDLSTPGVLPDTVFDAIVLTQTLHLIYDMAAAVEHIRRALKPGGVALVTVPGITPIDRDEWGASWFWSLTPAAMQRLFADAFGAENVTVSAYGNVFAATAFLHGVAVEEVSQAKLDPYDEAFPVIVAVRVQAVSGVPASRA